MQKISSGIKSLDRLIDFLHIGDNVVWEADAGTSYDIFNKNFIRQSFEDKQKVIYVNFNKSPQTIMNNLESFVSPDHLILVDCFTAGKGKNDRTFLKFYDKHANSNIIKIENPNSIQDFTTAINHIEDNLPPGARYVFDSLTGMQDLWGDENITYKFFTYMCPRLYDLDTVAYWILEKDAHSQKFKANLRHITQVVFDLYKRKDSLFIKAVRLDGRQEREAFKPHLYEIEGMSVSITLLKKEPQTAIGNKIKELRTKLGLTQKELADRIDVTSSFISQIENNQISPSLSSFLQLCSALGIQPSQLIETSRSSSTPWLIRKEMVLSKSPVIEDNVKIYMVQVNNHMSVRIIIVPPDTILNRHFFYTKGQEYLYILKGEATVTIDGKKEHLCTGDSLHLTESFPSQWISNDPEGVEILAVV